MPRRIRDMHAGEKMDRVVHAVLPPRRDGSVWPLLPFSTDPHVAWDLFDEMRSWPGVMELSITAPHWDGRPRTFHPNWLVFYGVEFPDGESDSHYRAAETMPLAVCQVAHYLAPDKDDS